jgi:hypothetical protein
MATRLRSSIIIYYAGACVLVACSSGVPANPGAGGSTSSNGGASLSSGGSSGKAGDSTAGGGAASTSGGASISATSGVGGSTGQGGTSGAGGSGTSGGSMSTGGTTVGVTGGTTSTGGRSSQGGGSVAPSGGATATGDSKAFGGTSSLGGSKPTGGSSSTGGSKQTGGSGGAATGGASAGGAGADMPLVYAVENTGADCTVPTSFPAFSALTAIPNLPDPFLMTSGTRIASRDDWRCRRAEISSLMQHWESGPKGAPPSNLTATYSGGKLTVVVTQGSASITLSGTITTPSGAGPFPLVIGMNTPTGSLPSSIFTGVATLTFTSSQMGISDPFNVTRGAGTYFTMYPDTNAAAMIEWAWGVSRLIDGLYKTVDQNKIDVHRIAVTGCSYQGKMALYAGAFDERIALTIPEESGGGGEASWRFMATQTGTEDLEAAQGTAWYAANLKQFKNADAPKLPIDMHELVAMVAPRAILAIENTGIDRLGSQAGGVSMKAATEVYKALGIPDRIGYSQAAASAHCSFPTSQSLDVQAFVDKFLLGKTANTAIAKSSYSTDMTKWITWTTPQLQ